MIENLLPLESFRRVVGLHPFWFWGLSNSANVPVTSAADGLYYKYAWQQSNQLARQDMIQGIVDAEQKLKDYLSYWPAPRFTSAILSYPRPENTSLNYLYSIDADGRWLSVKLPDTKIQSVGVESKTLLETATLTYSDVDGDSINDTFTATTTATTTETDITRIAVYFASANRLNGDGATDEWLIAPVKVTINGNGTVTIRGRAWQCVSPILYEGVSVAGIDPTDATKFVTTLDIYIRKTDPNGITTATSQGMLEWETTPYPPYCVCGSDLTYSPSATDPAAIAQAIARVGLRDAELGYVIPGEATYDSTTGLWSSVGWGSYSQPARITIRYRAGQELQDGEMAREWQDIVAKLACAEMPRRIAAKDVGNRAIYQWQFDLSRSAGAGDEQYQISQADLDNPFGTLRGQVYAWKKVKRLAIFRGVIA